MAGALKKSVARSALSKSAIAARADVDPGQTSRILDGKFQTISGNVVRICNVLGIDPQAPDGSPTANQVRRNAAWARLEASLRRAWDDTPQGADRLAAVIDAVALVRAPRRDASETAANPKEGTAR